MRLLPLLLLLILSCHGHAKPGSPKFTSIFSFGNSFADTGNLVILATPVLKDIRIAMPPYGDSFFHHPTGQLSDGRIALDFLAEEFDLLFVPPYLAHNASFEQGENFAVAGAEALDFDFFVKNNLSNSNLLMFNSSLSVQLGWFSELKPSLCKFSEECQEYFSKSLFIIGEFGANDYANMISGGKSLEQVHGYVPMVIETISAATESLIKEGVKTIILPGLWPLGCTPENLAQNTSRPKEDYEPETGCLKDWNYLLRHHNEELSKAITQLQHKYPHVRLIYANNYRPIIDFVSMPGRFVFIDTPLRVCCGNTNHYNFDQNEACGMPGVGSCKNPMEYVTWDGAHLTEAAYHHIAEGWLRGPDAEPSIPSIVN